jgi:hypothetical protein
MEERLFGDGREGRKEALSQLSVHEIQELN